MSSVNIEEKQLLFDYCIGIASQEDSEKARRLIAGNKEASLLFSKIQATLAPLDNVRMEICPDHLVEATLLRIRNIPNPNKDLTELLKVEQNKRSPIKIGFLRNFSEVAAIAAALIFITGILVPTFGYARQKYWQQQCAMGINDIYQGFQRYMSDNDNKPPTVARAAGAPWWRIGNEKESNTSHMYLLVANGYVKPEKFICPGDRKLKKSKEFNESFRAYAAKCQSYKDFPDSRFVSYSFPIGCQKQANGKMSCRKIMMADKNPIFESLPTDYSQPLTIELKSELLKANSSNHDNRGQNVLYGDGRVEFAKKRQIGTVLDDLFTLRYTDLYIGNETPSCDEDIFLAP